MSLQYLSLCKELEVLRIPDEVYLVLRLAAEGKKVARGLAIKARAALTGWPDELVFKGVKSCPYAIAMIRENKSETGRLTPGQKSFYARLAAKGIPHQIPHTLDANLDQSRQFLNYEGPLPLESSAN